MDQQTNTRYLNNIVRGSAYCLYHYLTPTEFDVVVFLPIRLQAESALLIRNEVLARARFLIYEKVCSALNFAYPLPNFLFPRIYQAGFIFGALSGSVYSYLV